LTVTRRRTVSTLRCTETGLFPGFGVVSREYVYSIDNTMFSQLRLAVAISVAEEGDGGCMWQPSGEVL
jgi:hypothetical protein